MAHLEFPGSGSLSSLQGPFAYRPPGSNRVPTPAAYAALLLVVCLKLARNARTQTPTLCYLCARCWFELELEFAQRGGAHAKSEVRAHQGPVVVQCSGSTDIAFSSQIALRARNSQPPNFMFPQFQYLHSLPNPGQSTGLPMEILVVKSQWTDILAALLCTLMFCFVQNVLPWGLSPFP